MKVTRGLAAVAVLTGIAFAGNQTLTLTVTPDDTVTAGSTVDISVDGTNAGDFVFLAFGAETGTTTIDLGTSSIDLGLAQPFGLLPLPGGGVSFEVPAVPGGLEGTTLNLQALAIGIEFGGGGPPAVTGCTSNLDTLSF